MPSLLEVMLQAWGLCALIMLVMWLIELKTNNAAYVDVGWALGLAVCVTLYAYVLPGYVERKWILALMVILWAARLIYHLLVRIQKEGQEDKRYEKIRVDWKIQQHGKFFLFFQFQAFLDIILSMTWLPGMRNMHGQLMALEWAGVVIWICGFLGESMADAQLKAFKANLANRGKTCQTGWWNYSRHPNYFFEWLMWVGYMVFALASSWGWVSMVGPLLMYYFLMKVSGVPLAEEQALKTRGEAYRHYQQTTSMFVPLPKKYTLPSL